MVCFRFRGKGKSCSRQGWMITRMRGSDSMIPDSRSFVRGELSSANFMPSSFNSSRYRSGCKTSRSSRSCFFKRSSDDFTA